MKINWKNIDIKDLAAIVSEKLNEKGIEAILVGGACISIYTKNRYLSSDLDFISHTTLKEITEALSELDFKRGSSRHFIRKNCPFFIEFVSPPAAIGSEPIKSKTEIKTKFGKIVLLTPTDSVKDRLAAYYHWNDPQALEQAIMVAKAQKIDLKEIRRWSVKERHKEKYDIFASMIKLSQPS
ncbi:MAG: hypothetical protein M0Z70_05630 [Nitrospiraceae bacterium]|nr:hypothetical protein [Nitrospiraceae bacterium]